MSARLVRRMAATTGAICLTLVGLVSPSAHAIDVAAGSLVSDNPAGNSPYVLNGRVLSIEQVGNTLVAGGTFTSVSNAGGASIGRTNLFAFDNTTGQVSTTFLPQPNGTVEVVIPAGDGASVYVGGSFTTIGGVARKNLARVRVSDGVVLDGFNAGNITGVVKDLRLVNGRLWVAGGFTHVSGTPRRALATLNPDTGALTNYSVIDIAGLHNGGTTTVSKIDTDPNGTRLVGVGNFDTLDGSQSHQILLLDIAGPSAAVSGFRTGFYLTACSRSFNSYMRDVDFAPDGSFFVVTTTGAYGGAGTACDSSARFEADAVGSDVRPTWIDNTGGDTTYAVEITDSVVYVGGHARWQNNPFAGDTPGPGAVPRPGIAALSPVNGLPYSWNPTRDRGVGVFDFHINSRGLWLGSDTSYIGGEYHPRLALMPTVGGTAIPQQRTPAVPNQIYSAGLTGASTDPRVLYRVNAAGPVQAASTGVDWAADTDASPSPYQNGSSNRSDWGSLVPTVDATVPAGTPRAIYTTELWDPAGGAEQTWNFPVQAGLPLEVRLYFADRYSGTSTPGARVFDVSIEGNLVLDDFDITATVGHDTGTMRSFSVVSDGSINVLLGHVVENPLINGIEILRTDIPAGAGASITRRDYNGSIVGPELSVGAGGIDWASVRGAFMLNGQLYLGWANGTFDRRSFDGTTFGVPTPVNTQDQLVPLTAWQTDLASMTGAFFTFGRIYFTRAGSNQLFYRYFEPESSVVGAQRFVASTGVAGIDFAQVRGMFLAGDQLYFASPDASLRRIQWQHAPGAGAPVTGTTALVSGPGVDGVSWSAHDLFLYQDAAGNDGAIDFNQAPTAAISLSCTGLSCSLSGAGSSDVDGSITAYAWDFGDGSPVGSGVSVSHSYAAAGTYTVALTVTDDDGASGTATTSVAVVELPNEAPTAAISVSCTDLSCSLSGAGSSDVDGSITAYAWDFGDGSPVGSGVSVSHSYAAAGTYTVALTVTDDDGAIGSSTTPVTVAINEAPTAAISVSCTDLSCSLSGAGSSDVDGSITAYAWDFGDGSPVGSGVSLSHSYAAPGAYTVSLTVTDDDGATGTTSTAATATAPASAVQFVAAASTNGNRTNHRVTIPAGVATGDTLVAFLTTNSATSTLGAMPAGWTPLPSLDATSLRARAWTKTATAADAGATLTVTSSGYIKSDFSVAAYRATATAIAVSASAARLDTSGNPTVTSPTVTVSTSGSWLLTYWARKSSSATSTWLVPAEQVLRTSSVGSGSGNIAAMITDSDGPVPVGTAGGISAGLTEGSSQVPIYSVVVGVAP